MFRRMSKRSRNIAWRAYALGVIAFTLFTIPALILLGLMALISLDPDDSMEDRIMHPSLATAAEGMRKYPNDPLAQYQMARYLYDTKQYAKAIPYLKKALELPSRSDFPGPDVRMYLGNCLVETGKRKEARAEWLTILKDMPYNPADPERTVSTQAHKQLEAYP